MKNNQKIMINMVYILQK